MNLKEKIRFIKNKKYIVNEGIWTIGITETNTPINFKDAKYKQIIKPEDITDAYAEFVADPFLIKVKNKYYLFYEILDFISCKGVIGVSESVDKYNWIYKGIILKEDFHLSYPQVFEINNEYYMIPESYQSGQVRIYKAIDFPLKWKMERVILEGEYLDNTFIKYNDKWWLFNESIEENKKSLRLFYSDDLLGEWKEHVSNPLIYDDIKISRPAGKVVEYKGNLYRFAQDCSLRYGKSINAFKINTINEYQYDEEYFETILTESGVQGDWNSDGMHTVNSIKDGEKYFCCVDGYYLKKKNLITNKIKRELYKVFY